MTRPNTPADSLRGEIDVDLFPFKLRLCFRMAAYRLLEKLTGVRHFERITTKFEESQSIESMAAFIYTGAQKYHAQDFGLTLEAVAEAIDQLSGYEGAELWKTVVTAFTDSNRAPVPVNPTPEPPTTPAAPAALLPTTETTTSAA
jgi:hypothetical protein